MRRGSWTAVAVAARAFVSVLAAALEHLDAPANDSDPWVRPVVYLRGVVPARVVNAACNGGEIEGAVKRGKSWVAKQSACDAYVRASKPAQDEDVAATIARWTGRAA